jgi:hypothetical protein
MRMPFILLLSCLIALAGCSKFKNPQSTGDAPPVDACTLLTSKEIESINGESVEDTKPSGNSGGEFVVSQCYFTLATPVNSVVLTVTQRANGATGRDPKQFWKETFPREGDSDKIREKAREKEGEEKESPTPEKIEGVGEEAFWVGNRFGGALYVLKGNRYIRISVGGGDDQATKIKKSKALAEMVLKRL